MTQVYSRMGALVEIIAKDADYPTSPWLYCECFYEDTGDSNKRWILVSDLRAEGGISILNEIIDAVPHKVYVEE